MLLHTCCVCLYVINNTLFLLAKFYRLKHLKESRCHCYFVFVDGKYSNLYLFVCLFVAAYMPMPSGCTGTRAALYPPYPTGSAYQPATSNQYPYPPYPSTVYPNFPSTSYPYPPSTNHAFPPYPPSYPAPQQSGNVSVIT